MMADLKPICSVEGCGKPRKAKGVCLYHYQQTYSQGKCTSEGCGNTAVAKKLCRPCYNLQYVRADYGPCIVPECESRARGKGGLCSAHDHRKRRHGDPLAGKIPSGERLEWLKRNMGFAGPECLPWPYGQDGRGYGQMSMDGVSMTAARAMCLLVYGEPSADDLQAAHSCGNSICCNPKHLRWATPLENNADKVAHGTHLCGASIPWAKLCEADVREIRRRYGRQRTREIADMFGISPGTVSAVASRRTWAWLD